MLKVVPYDSVVGSYFIEADVSDEVAAFIDECERKERSYRRSCRRHHLCSLDAVTENTVPDHKDTFAVVYGKYYQALVELAMEKLTNSQRRRFELQRAGFTLEEIADFEKVSIASIHESINGAKKKLRKFLADEFGKEN